jgi:3-oxoadipate enol-lactonase
MTLVWLSDLRLNAALSGPSHAAPLVLIHGLGLDLRLWDALLPHLPGRILRLDLRGHGASDTPPPPYALGTLIRDVERLIDHFALRETVVLGLGEGGLIAQGLAAKRLDLVRALVLTGAATRFGTPELWSRRIAEGFQPDRELATFLGPRAGAHAEAEVRAMLDRTRAEGWAGLAAATATADLYQIAAGLTLPSLVLAGADDRKVPPDMQRDLAHLLRGSHWHLLPGAGHLGMLTHPEPFAEAVTGFLARLGLLG